MIRTSTLVLGVLTLAIGSHFASASPITILNPSFEAVTLSDNTAADNNIPSWTLTGSPQGTFNPPASAIDQSQVDGSNVAFLAAIGSISQTLSATLQANVDYTLTLEIGDRLDQGAPNYRVELLAGSTVLVSKTDVDFPTVDGHFVNVTLDHIATGSDPLGSPLAIAIFNTGAGDRQVFVDNVQLSAVPEPTSCLLLTLGIVGLVAAGRRRRQVR